MKSKKSGKKKNELWVTVWAVVRNYIEYGWYNKNKSKALKVIIKKFPDTKLNKIENMFDEYCELINESNSKVLNYVRIDPNKKTKYLFSLKPDYREHLKDGIVSDAIRMTFEGQKHPLSSIATISTMDKKRWKIQDDFGTFSIEDAGKQLNIYKSKYVEYEDIDFDLFVKDLKTKYPNCGIKAVKGFANWSIFWHYLK